MSPDTTRSYVERRRPIAYARRERGDRARLPADPGGGSESIFNGSVNRVQLGVDDAAEDLDHLITPEERLRVAMARQ
jgi:hypothetical protein